MTRTHFLIILATSLGFSFPLYTLNPSRIVNLSRVLAKTAPSTTLPKHRNNPQLDLLVHANREAFSNALRSIKEPNPRIVDANIKTMLQIRTTLTYMWPEMKGRATASSQIMAICHDWWKMRQLLLNHGLLNEMRKPSMMTLVMHAQALIATTPPLAQGRRRRQFSSWNPALRRDLWLLNGVPRLPNRGRNHAHPYPSG